MTRTISQPETDLEAAIQSLGLDLWQRIRGRTPGLFDRHAWAGKLLEAAFSDPALKLDLFRLVDVLPSLHTNEQVARHVQEYLQRDGRDLGMLLGAALKLSALGPAKALAARTIRANVANLAQQFILGRDPREALPGLRQLRSERLAFTADLLGEATLSDTEADAYQKRYLELIDVLAVETAGWQDDPLLDRDHMGPLPRANISLKISALAPNLDPAAPADGVRRLIQCVRPILLRARQRSVFVNFDLEQWSLHGITYDLFESLALASELRDWPHLGIVVQAYLKDAAVDVERLRDLARRRGTSLTVRLVKGAYWETEVALADQFGWACPVFTSKVQTDASYERLTAQLFDGIEDFRPALGSHNLRSLTHALALAQKWRLNPGAFEVQMLLGMAEPERETLRDAGCRVRLYCPIGELLPGMAYLVRRLLENTSNEGFLRRTHHDQADVAGLLAPPDRNALSPPSPSRRVMVPGDPTTPFQNAPLADFTDPTVRDSFAKALAAVRGRFPLRIPGGVSGPTIDRCCPFEPALVVARVNGSSEAEVDQAVEATLRGRGWPAWRDKPLEERAGLLERLGDVLERDRLELAALEVWETAKPWREADADVAEAIDYCRYYARLALVELSPRKLPSPTGEDNRLIYEGRGPAAIIAPWNFPLAIPTGMTAAALVAGDTVLLKPAEQSTAVGYTLFERLREAGFPKDVVQFLPGPGETVGARLVAHPGVAQIAFTGSKAVGLAILERAARTAAGQPQVKRVVCEMGGKNAMVVDDDADLDEAVAGVLHSAFGYAGQKCSACSRLIVVGDIYEPLVARLVEACKSLALGPANDPACQIPPVIDRESQQRLLDVIRRANAGADGGVTPIYTGPVRGDGWYVPVTVLGVNDRTHPIWREELFGPILAVMRVPDFDSALDAALDSEFALTGGLYSRTPSHLEQARQRWRVGNLYFNRQCTGAMIARQPFGGFGMSGVGAKAGGPGYLLQFAQQRTISENTMRHGLTPELDG